MVTHSTFSPALLLVHRRIASLGLVALVTLGACIPSRVRREYVVSSETSEYSPVVHLAVRVRVDDSVRVTVDSGRLVAPGTSSGPGRALMRDLVLEALVAERSPDGMREPGVPGAWRVVATAAAQPVADSVVVGVPVDVPRMQFVMPVTPALVARRAWIVFRVRGGAMSTPAVLADGTQLPSVLMEGGVRVHACAVRTLTGHLDRRRARRLAKDYLATC